MVAAGATRVGASAGVKIVQESKGQKPAAGAGIRLLTSGPARAGRRSRVDGHRERNREPLLLERLDDPAAQLAADDPLFQRHGLDSRLHLHRPLAERIDPEDLNRREDGRPERRVRLQCRTDLAHEPPRSDRCRRSTTPTDR